LKPLRQKSKYQIKVGSHLPGRERIKVRVMY
jgi:hypothetical protein